MRMVKVYFRLIIRIQNVLYNKIIQASTIHHHELPYVVHIRDIGTRGIKSTYFIIIDTGKSIIQNIQLQWLKNMNEEINVGIIIKAFKNAKTFAPSVYQHINQCKLLHRRSIHNKLPYTMGL